MIKDMTRTVGISIIFTASFVAILIILMLLLALIDTNKNTVPYEQPAPVITRMVMPYVDCFYDVNGTVANPPCIIRSN